MECHWYCFMSYYWYFWSFVSVYVELGSFSQEHCRILNNSVRDLPRAPPNTSIRDQDLEVSGKSVDDMVISAVSWIVWRLLCSCFTPCPVWKHVNI